METKELIQLIIGSDIRTIIAIGVMFWIFYNKINKRFDLVDKRFDIIEEKITDIDRRVCRIEGALASKDCCVLKESEKIKKAE